MTAGSASFGLPDMQVVQDLHNSGCVKPVIITLLAFTKYGAYIILIFLTFLLLVFEVGGEGNEVPAGPGTHKWDGGAVVAFRSLFPLADVSDVHLLCRNESRCALLCLFKAHCITLSNCVPKPGVKQRK